MIYKSFVKFGTIRELVENQDELLLCDPQSVVQREMMISNQERQQVTNEIRREEIASGRNIL
jgi:hypothetical protein